MARPQRDGDLDQRLAALDGECGPMEWVLRGYYGFAAEQVLLVFDQLLQHPCLQVGDRPVLEQGVAGLRSGLDFADALDHASCKGCAAIASFDDRGFARRIRQLNLPPRVMVPAALGTAAAL
ncbi:MAG: hypothetical protein ACKOXO_04955 [Cyanobium sp.]